MNSSYGPKHALSTHHHDAENTTYSSHRERIITAQADMAALEAIDLSTASRAEMALAFERMRGGYADLIRMEMEHHPAD